MPLAALRRRAPSRRPRRGYAAAALTLSAALLTGLTGTADAAGARVDNPYVAARVYVNPQWSAHAAAEPGGAAVANQPTGVWLDSIASINGKPGSMGLRAHLDEALKQGAGVIQLVLHNLPGRDCNRPQDSTGELGPTEIARYRTDYVDPIAGILGDPAYAGLRIVTIVEYNALANVIPGVPAATPECEVMRANGNYVTGIGYALARFGALPNVYSYLDIGQHGQLGRSWDGSISSSVVQPFYRAATASGSTVGNVQGFIANTADYSVLHEEYYTVNDRIAGVSVRQSRWVDGNAFIDELPFVQGFRNLAIASGFKSTIGMLVDTSRNGWGGPNRPTRSGPATTVDAYVDGSRLDRRISIANWCNQSGAGLGRRPVAVPEAGVHAYVWAKPPGESDGASSGSPGSTSPNRMCDPTGSSPGGQLGSSGALPGGPAAGEWFSGEFQQLLRNAYPPLFVLSEHS
ncbi:glycoside hydrolase family 6 protein [Peterkaempfera bronchialis]|uniref:Glucanase n=1 Tax=Peterkaempfera bronchialis TaxID=2126346 RepID=A0A345T1A9_9ACTN|nr:glycoside hydrolase family 6 protein [Peterkaempfera bronchialis]AXI79764.1 cellobiohydrolase [Peterkaempfera bronchialis]